MMRVLTVDPSAPAGPGRIRPGRAEVPTPSGKELLVRVTAVPLSAFEKSIVTDGDPRRVRKAIGTRTAPLGLEFAGVVARAAHGFAEGERVAGSVHFTRGERALAEYTVTRPGWIARIPDGLSDVDAAALAVSGETAHRAVGAARISAGDEVVVVGAGGGVGVYATQLAALRGARVTAIAGAEAAELLSGLGAHTVHDRLRTGLSDLGTCAAILDTSGTVRFAEARRHLAPTGAFVTTTPHLDPVGILRAVMGRRRMPIVYVPHTTTATLRESFMLARSGRLRPVVEAVYPADELSRALDRLAGRGRTGKIVVTI